MIWKHVEGMNLLNVFFSSERFETRRRSRQGREEGAGLIDGTAGTWEIIQNKMVCSVGKERTQSNNNNNTNRSVWLPNETHVAMAAACEAAFNYSQ